MRKATYTIKKLKWVKEENNTNCDSWITVPFCYRAEIQDDKMILFGCKYKPALFDNFSALKKFASSDWHDRAKHFLDKVGFINE